MAINNLSQGEFSSASQIPFYDPSNGSDRRGSVQDLADALEPLLPTSGGLQTQYAAPSATGFSVTISPAVEGQSVWLLLTPNAGYAAGTIVLPVALDGQEVVVNTTQAVTTLTINGNGASVTGAPTTLAANAFFRLRKDGVLNGWYRIG